MENNYNYLDLLERKLDPQQRKVCCRTENTVVAAGAGSGKTQVLATRFAWLVMSKGVPASKILTITFTKKATGEMYERIYQTLSFFAENPQTPETERKRAQQALEDFSNVHIQTFDSYCKGIVEQAASEYGIRPDFSVGSGDSESDIKKQALPFVFQNRKSQAIKTFAGVGKYQDFADKLLSKTIIDNTSIITPPDFFVKKLELQKKEVIQAWNFLLLGETAKTNACPVSLKDAYNEYLETSKNGEKINLCAPNLNAGFQSFISAFDDCQCFSHDVYIAAQKAKDALDSISLYDFLLPSDFDFENPDSQILSKIDQLLALFEIFAKLPVSTAKDLKDLCSTIKPLRLNNSGEQVFLQTHLISIANYIKNYSAIKSLNELFDSFTSLINRQKRLSGNLTFKDVSELSLEILINHKEIRAQEKRAFDKIMIDEFQDNNGKNRDLLFLVSELDFPNEEKGCKDGIPSANEIVGDKLFFVGDEKQSIYKFRGAEVSVFNELKTSLGENSFLQMIYNYRSDKELITGFNRIFGSMSNIFDSHTDKTYEAKYENKAVKFDPKSGRECEEPQLTLENSRIHLCALDTRLLSEDPENRLLDEKNQTAYFIAKKISQMIKKAGEEGHQLKYSDFAILDKSRQRRQLLIWLNYFGIPYQLDQNTDIFTDGPVNDIYNFLRLCVYPGDKNALAAFLASPFCKLNQKALQTILTEHALSTLPETEEELANLAESLLEESSQIQKKRFAKGILYIKAKAHQVLSQKLSSTINDLWYESGYHYATMENQKTELYAELFDFLFELARQCDENQKNISWFVDQLAIVKNKETFSQDDEEIDVKEISYPLEAKDAVQIMTIHKSKGLQFKYVFISGCIGAGRKGDRARVFFDETYGASIKPESGSANYFALTQKALSDKKDLAEFRRLIYVAITRAISEVYIVGAWAPYNSKGKPKEFDEGSFHLIEQTAMYFYGDQLAEKDFSLGKESLSNLDQAPFTYEGIAPVTKEETYSSNTENKCKTRIFSPLPADTEEIPYDEPVSNRRTPSSLEPGVTAPVADGTNSTSDALLDQKYDSPDDTLDSAAFTAADFGTLVHDYLRAQAEGIEPEEYQAPVKLFKQLTEREIASIKAEAIKMCRDFAASNFGKAAYNSQASARAADRLLKAEWAFRMSYEGFIWTGSIDLIYENADGTFTIIDYKSDNEIVPERYTAQQETYRTAAAKLLHIAEEKISCHLWYLRHNKSVEIKF